MQISPLTEEAAEELLTTTAPQERHVRIRILQYPPVEVLARKQIVSEIWDIYPWQHLLSGPSSADPLVLLPISCEDYSIRRDESRDADLEERSVLTNYPSVWTAFDTCFRNILSDGSSNSKRQRNWHSFVASFEDSLNLGDQSDCIACLLATTYQVQSSSQNTNAKVPRELRFLDQDFSDDPSTG